MVPPVMHVLPCIMVLEVFKYVIHAGNGTSARLKTWNELYFLYRSSMNAITDLLHTPFSHTSLKIRK